MALNASQLGVSVPNWVLLQTSTPSGVSFVTFSGLSGYSKYRLMAAGLVAVSGSTVLTLNGAGSGYASVSLQNNGAGPLNASPGATSSITVSNASAAGTVPAFDLQIDNALILAPKGITGWGTDSISSGASTGNLSINGVYTTTSSLTSITLTRTANFTSGSIYLMGAN